MTDPRICILCGGSALLERHLSATELREQYEKDVGLQAPDNVEFWDISEFRCSACDLDFTQPMRAGSPNFYKWVTSEGEGYANGRWEWRVVADILGKQLVHALNGLDVGCGSGNFIALLSEQTAVEMMGIDTNHSAVAEARRRGINAAVTDISGVALSGKLYDFVCAFHCLEHVESPVSFVGDVRKVLRPGGSFFFSVPITPTAIEFSGLDPRNHAPHHLTRWNQRSLQSLAQSLGFKSRLIFPAQVRSFRLALYATSFKFSKGPKINMHYGWWSGALKHPIAFLRTWQKIRKSARKGQPVRDVVLCWARFD